MAASAANAGLIVGRDRVTGSTARLAIASFVFYSSIFFIKMAMFAASWRGETFLGRDFKTSLALAQTLGYLAGKGPALALSPKLERRQLLPAMLAIVWGAGSLVVASALAPPWLGVPCVSAACVFLSPSWSVLQRSIEGRTHTEAIVATVSFSYIGVAGVVKSFGAALMQRGLSERAMVRTCASIGLVCGTASAIVVGRHPPPSAWDVKRRGSRARLVSVRQEGAQLLARYGTGLSLAVSAYVLCGVLRAYRDFYQAELFAAAGLRDSPAAFTTSEMTISALVLVATACFSRITDNVAALHAMVGTACAGGVLVSASTAGWRAGLLSAYSWIVTVGTGTFLAYVPLGCMVYERLLAAAEEQVTSTPLQLVSDAAVLLGTSVLLGLRQRAAGGSAPAGGVSGGDDAAVASFFASMALVVGILVALIMLAAGAAFTVAISRRRKAARTAAERGGLARAPLGGEAVAEAGSGLAIPLDHAVGSGTQHHYGGQHLIHLPHAHAAAADAQNGGARSPCRAGGALFAGGGADGIVRDSTVAAGSCAAAGALVRSQPTLHGGSGRGPLLGGGADGDYDGAGAAAAFASASSSS